MCSICRSASREEVASAIAAGESLRAVARRFSFSRAATQRHAKNCLMLKRDASAEARLAAKERHGVLSADLDLAYQSALALKEKAEASNDLGALVKCERHLARLLQLRQRAAGKLLPEVSMVPQRQFRDARFRAVYFYPEEVQGFASSVRKQPGPESPTIGFRIMWQRETRGDLKAEADADAVEAALDLSAKLKAAEELN